MSETIVRRNEIEAIYASLDRLCQRQPDLSRICDYYRDLLLLQVLTQAEVLPFEMDPGCAQEKINSGVALLVGEGLPFSVSKALSLCAHICEVVGAAVERGGITAAAPPELRALGQDSSQHPALRSLRQAAIRGDLGLLPVFYSLLWADQDPLEKLSQSVRLDLPLMRSIVRNCLRPFLRVWSAGLASQVDVTAWGRGTCPFCGGAPALAELRGSTPERFLRCSLCGAGWPFGRWVCPNCGNAEAGSKGSICSKSEPDRVSAQACDRCHTYLKTIVTDEPIPAYLLPIADLETADLDVLAVDKGYRRLDA
jgi:FdhE protein